MFPTRPPDGPAGEAPMLEAVARSDGEDQTEVAHAGQRRWYHLRPKPRRSTDLWGFNSTWWMVLGWPLLIVFALSPWPWW
jgi:hypothetical protein